MDILILDRNTARKQQLSEAIRALLPAQRGDFHFARQSDIFDAETDRSYAAAFLWIEGMPDLEAARQLMRLWPALPVVMVSDTKDFGVEGFHLGVRYYLCAPVETDALAQAMERCALLGA